MLKKYSLFVSIVYSLLLAALSLFKINAVGPELPSNSDKVFHGLAYLIFTLLWFYTLFFKNKNSTKSLIYAFLSAVIFGIIIEILQGTLTQNRQADLIDVIANIIGTIIASLIIISIKKGMLKNNNTLLF